MTTSVHRSLTHSLIHSQFISSLLHHLLYFIGWSLLLIHDPLKPWEVPAGMRLGKAAFPLWSVWKSPLSTHFPIAHEHLFR